MFYFYIFLFGLLFLTCSSYAIILYQSRTSSKLLKRPLGLIVDNFSKSFYQTYSIYFFIQNALILYIIKSSGNDTLASYINFFMFAGAQAVLFHLVTTYDSLLNYILLRWYISPAINKVIYRCFGLKVKCQVHLTEESSFDNWVIKVYQQSNNQEIIIDIHEQSKPLSNFNDYFTSLAKEEFLLKHL